MAKRNTYFQDEVIERKIDIKQFGKVLRYILPYKKIFLFVCFLMAFSSIVSMITPLLLKKIIDEVKKINPEVIVFYHSCGFVEPLIPHLIEAGIDVLNPIQSECMDFEEIYRKYGDKISFHGTIGTQTVMPHGTPKEVKETVWRNLDIAGDKGGLFVAPTHLLEPEVPFEVHVIFLC